MPTSSIVATVTSGGSAVSATVRPAPTADASVNKPTVIEPFPLEDLQNVVAPYGVHDGFILVYDGEAGKWTIQAAPPWELPDIPEFQLLLDGNTGSDTIVRGRRLAIVGASGVSTAVALGTLTITVDEIDGGTF